MYNFRKVFSVFRKNYELVPLEVFGKHQYKTLVSTILSSRTNDDVTLKASQRLFEKAPNLKLLAELSEKEIREAIYPVGFYKTKATHLRRMAKTLLSKSGGKIPSSREMLMELPGVGRKTANLVLNRAFSIPAIAVDTHVHKISNLLGWVDTKTPEETEKELVKILPKEYWNDTNRLFVSIGRQYKSKGKIIKFLEENGLL